MTASVGSSTAPATAPVTNLLDDERLLLGKLGARTDELENLFSWSRNASALQYKITTAYTQSLKGPASPFVARNVMTVDNRTYIMYRCPQGATTELELGEIRTIMDIIVEKRTCAMVSLLSSSDRADNYKPFWQKAKLEPIVTDKGCSFEVTEPAPASGASSLLSGYVSPSIIERSIARKQGPEPKDEAITHLHYDGWPDLLGVPDRPLFHRLLNRIEAIQARGFAKEGVHSPVAVHCWAGVYRSGITVLSLHVRALLRKMIMDAACTGRPLSQCTLNIPELIVQFRKERLYFLDHAPSIESSYRVASQFAEGLLLQERHLRQISGLPAQLTHTVLSYATFEYEPDSIGSEKAQAALFKYGIKDPQYTLQKSDRERFLKMINMHTCYPDPMYEASGSEKWAEAAHLKVELKERFQLIYRPEVTNLADTKVDFIMPGTKSLDAATVMEYVEIVLKYQPFTTENRPISFLADFSNRDLLCAVMISCCLRDQIRSRCSGAISFQPKTNVPKAIVHFQRMYGLLADPDQVMRLIYQNVSSYFLQVSSAAEADPDEFDNVTPAFQYIKL